VLIFLFENMSILAIVVGLALVLLLGWFVMSMFGGD
jgi:hypothetical protein